jgi:hypothetical protein
VGQLLGTPDLEAQRLEQHRRASRAAQRAAPARSVQLLAGLLALACAGGARAEEAPVELPLRAGAAVVAVEVPEGAPLAGYSERGPFNHHQGGLAPIEARALVIAGRGGRPRLALVTLDILLVTPPLRAALRELAAPLELDGLIVAATHTHSGPGGYVSAWIPEAGILGWYDAGVLRALTRAAGLALEHAARALAPAALGVAVASSPALAINRRHANGPIDPSIPVLRVDGASGVPIATLFALAAHPAVMRPDNALLSPDYPGAARAFVEANRGGIALFVAGPLGDQNARVAAKSADAAAQQRDARALGEQLGALVVEAAALASPADDAPVAFAEVVYRPPAIDVRSACAGFIFAPFYYAVARYTLPSESVLAAARLGGLRLLASPYELGVEVAARIREQAPGPLMLVAHANDWLGYLLEPDDLAAGGYESCLAVHGSGAALPFAAAVRELLGPLAPPAPAP